MAATQFRSGALSNGLTAGSRDGNPITRKSRFFNPLHTREDSNIVTRSVRKDLSNANAMGGCNLSATRRPLCLPLVTRRRRSCFPGVANQLSSDLGVGSFEVEGKLALQEEEAPISGGTGDLETYSPDIKHELLMLSLPAILELRSPPFLMDSRSSSDGRSSTPDSLSPTFSSSSAVHRALELIQSDDQNSKLQGAQEIRRLTKTSQRCRRQLSDSVGPLVCMLRLRDSPESHESALLALLNLAVKDETNKIKIVEAGALEPIIAFLQSQSSTLQEYATAALLTLSASAVNKPVIGASSAIPLLVEILRHGSPQAKVDSVMALSNLSTHPSNLSIILEAKPIPSIVTLLKPCKKSSKTAERCCALIESLVGFDEGRTALTSEEGGVLAVIEVLENGLLQSREHAVSTLLTMCQSDRCRYREAILKDGVIPGLLELTVQGTPKSQTKAHTLLRLLRESPYPRSELEADTLENIVCNIISQIDSDDQSSKAKKILADMVQVSMEQSLRHLQQRALVCTSTDLPISTCTSEVSLK